MGTLRHHGGDRWSVRVYVGNDPGTGRPRRRSLTFTAKNQREAERLRSRYEAQLVAERDAQAEQRGTIAELVDDWLTISRRDRSPSTMVAYERHCRRIRQRFGRTPVDKLSVRDVDAWYTSLMAGGMTATNLRHVHRVLSAVLRFGYRKGRAPDPVTGRVTLPEVPDREIAPPTTEVVRSVFHSLPDAAWARAVALLATTGMRRGEVVGLEWADVDFDAARLTIRHSVIELPGGELFVKEPKGRRVRTIRLSPPAVQILALQAASQHEGERYVFGHTPARPGWVSLMWGRWRSAHGAEGVRLHDLRHWYATHALESGAPINSVSRQLGHARTSTTLDIYGHGTDPGEAVISDAIGAVFGS